MAAIVEQESGGDPLVIHDNKTSNAFRPRSRQEAVAFAQRLIAAGDSIDLGLAQINSANLATLGLNAESVFEPCANLQAAQAILLEDWIRTGGDSYATLAAYHTGCVRRCNHEKALLGAVYSANVVAKAGDRPVAILIDGSMLDSNAEPPFNGSRPAFKPHGDPRGSPLTPRSSKFGRD
jgi:type IV secretion system protein VirB1